MTTRKQILEMLSAGEIDVTRATEMLNEARAGQDVPPVEEMPVPPAPPPAPENHVQVVRSKGGTRWLHIHVNELDSGKTRVRVNVPLGLVNWGLRIGARFTDELGDERIRDVVDALKDEQFAGTLVEVEDVEDNERVHIFID